MEWKGRKVLVTGGAGFVGSNIVDELVSQGAQVTVYDNLSTGKKEYLESSKEKIQLVEADILDLAELKKSMKGVDFVFHLAANADIRSGLENTRVDLEQNTIGTRNVLESMRVNDVKKIAFFSSSAMYGEPDVFPTPENYNSIQTSLYGASKLSGEALIQAFCEGFGMQSWIFRSVSLLGPRYSHGSIFDFIKKLKKNPKEMEILGDGKQKKSFIHVADCVQGILSAIARGEEKVNIFNLGTEDTILVDQIADIVADELGLENVTYKHTGGKRGWIGDAPTVYLDVQKLKKTGWKQAHSIEESIRETVNYLGQNPNLLERE